MLSRGKGVQQSQFSGCPAVASPSGACLALSNRTKIVRFSCQKSAAWKPQVEFFLLCQPDGFHDFRSEEPFPISPDLPAARTMNQQPLWRLRENATGIYHLPIVAVILGRRLLMEKETYQLA
jgi:hypothetical protein